MPHSDNISSKFSGAHGLPEDEIKNIHDYLHDCTNALNTSLQSHGLGHSRVILSVFGANLSNSNYVVTTQKKKRSQLQGQNVDTWIDTTAYELGCINGEFQTSRPDGMGAQNLLLMAMEEGVRHIVTEFTDNMAENLRQKYKGKLPKHIKQKIQNTYDDIDNFVRNITLASNIDEFKLSPSFGSSENPAIDRLINRPAELGPE